MRTNTALVQEEPLPSQFQDNQKMKLSGLGNDSLLKIAKAVAIELKTRIEGTRLRIRMPSRIIETETDGWVTTIGDLGKNRPNLEIWLDHFSGHHERKLIACVSGSRKQLTRLTDRVAKVLVPHRVITAADTSMDGFLVLSEPLHRDEFNVPILEKLEHGETYFGVYDKTRRTGNSVSLRFVQEAASFFESVARALPRATPEDESHEVYPRFENRTKVRLHLRRERSRMLATARKQIDNYTCQVCALRFPELYGEIGEEFAESHHLVPLSTLRDTVKTKVEDLATVCANCHRMLHRMDGERDDIVKLRAIVRRRQSKHK